jgi:murein DD-endopeptidase MepM/ murein hydrolase activator NlpD
VRAIRSGRVVQVGLHRGLGRFVELEHREQLHSLYAHLREVSVEPGTRVRQGEVIGTVGKTGNARHLWITPHVHLEVLQEGKPIDPQTLGLQVVDPSTLPHPTLADRFGPTLSRSERVDSAAGSGERRGKGMTEHASGGE